MGAKGRIVEINNGRLAMLGLMGFVSEATIPGSVPALQGLIKPYAGEVMAPFASNVFAGHHPRLRARAAGAHQAVRWRGDGAVCVQRLRARRCPVCTHRLLDEAVAWGVGREPWEWTSIQRCRNV